MLWNALYSDCITYSRFILMPATIDRSVDRKYRQIIKTFRPIYRQRGGNRQATCIPMLTARKTTKKHCFSVVGPATWNGLPIDLRHLSNSACSQFHYFLKTILFRFAWVGSVSEYMDLEGALYKFWLIDCRTDWLSDWLVGWLVDLLIDWLIDVRQKTIVNVYTDI